MADRVTASRAAAHARTGHERRLVRRWAARAGRAPRRGIPRADRWPAVLLHRRRRDDDWPDARGYLAAVDPRSGMNRVDMPARLGWAVILFGTVGGLSSPFAPKSSTPGLRASRCALAERGTIVVTPGPARSRPGRRSRVSDQYGGASAPAP